MSIINLKPSDVHAFASDNVSRTGDWFRDRNDLEGLVGELAYGYDASKGLIKVTPISKEDAAIALLEREKRLADLQNPTEALEIAIRDLDKTVDVSSDSVLMEFQRLYCDSKGKVLAPKYRVVAGFRRTTAIPYVAAARRMAGLKPEGDQPFNVVEYDNDKSRLEDCVMENMTANAGRRIMSNADKVSAACALYERGTRESGLVKVGYKRGSAQKLFAFARLNTKFPEEKLLERVMLDPDKPENKDRAIDFNGLDKEIMRKIADAGDVKQLHEYLEKPKANQPKIAAAKDIKALAEQTGVVPIRQILNAVVNNDLGALERLIPHKDRINALWAELFPQPVVTETPEATEAEDL